MAEPGLRERKKVATRLAISRAALKLAVEGGLNSLTGDAIADAANVAPRTFRNYFPSKEDALLYILVEFERSIVEAFQDQDNTAPVLDSLEAALVAVIESSAAELDDWLAVTRIVVLHPTLRAHYAANYNVNSSDLLDEIARRTETDPSVDMYPRIVSLSAFSVLRAALEMHVEVGLPRAEVPDAIRAGFAHLRRGLTEPVPADGHLLSQSR